MTTLIVCVIGLPKMIGGDEIEVEAGGVTFLLHLGANIDHLFMELAVKTSALYKLS
jgi:hypothetical protein